MTITLIRHAKVLADESQKMYASQVPKWVEHYNHAPIANTLPNSSVVRQIKEAKLIVASRLSRTSDSLKLLGIKPHITDSLFNEAEVPFVNIPYIKLSPRHWLIVLRLMMFVGIGGSSSTLKASKARASEATKLLIKFAKEHKSVALMGHGGMNWLISKELEKSGWCLIENNNSNRNWGYKIYKER